MTDVIDRIRAGLANIGIEIAEVAPSDGSVIIRCVGRANKRLASCSVPGGVLSSADEDAVVAWAIAEIKQQMASGFGTWPKEQAS